MIQNGVILTNVYDHEYYDELKHATILEVQRISEIDTTIFTG